MNRKGTQVPTKAFEQQATQGYYDDALATARLATKPVDLHWYIIELAKIHVQNGDVQGAKDIARMFPDWQPQIFKAIALAQAHQGDLSGALATSHPDMNEILEEFAQHQIKQADFPGALQTSERLPAIVPETCFMTSAMLCACAMNKNACVSSRQV